MDRLVTQWDCPDDCPRFETIGTPKLCPFCGSRGVLPVNDDVTVYEVPDIHYENSHDA